MVVWWRFKPEICLFMMLFLFDIISKNFINVHEYANKTICIIDNVMKGLCLHLNLVQSLVIYVYILLILKVHSHSLDLNYGLPWQLFFTWPKQIYFGNIFFALRVSKGTILHPMKIALGVQGKLDYILGVIYTIFT